MRAKFVKNTVIIRIFRVTTNDKISYIVNRSVIFHENFVAMRLRTLNLKSENFKYVALAKNVLFKKINRVGIFTNSHA